MLCGRCGTCEEGHTLQLSNYSGSLDIRCARKHFQVRNKVDPNTLPDDMPQVEDGNGNVIGKLVRFEAGKKNTYVETDKKAKGKKITWESTTFIIA